MARIDFYVLSSGGEKARQHFACKLAEKAWRLDNTVHIVAGSTAEAERLDALLWTFRDGSFVPHHNVSAQAAADSPMESPITIGCSSDQVPARDLLINLCDDIPAIAESFPRVAELVSSDDDAKQRSRKRYSQYRVQGHTIDTHNL